jgi:hypothetical protein
VTFDFENLKIVLQQELQYDGSRGGTVGAVIASQARAVHLLGAV